MTWPLALKLLVGVGGWETFWWARRRNLRSTVYRSAAVRASQLGKPLVVVGAPDGGVTAGYGCGDLTVDLFPSGVCPVPVVADVTKKLPFADDSAVVFVSCVLEYVSDFNRALKELRRVAGKNLYVVRVEPWTLAAYLYPGAKRTIPSALCEGPLSTHHPIQSFLP